jgi:hypothetical protein
MSKPVKKPSIEKMKKLEEFFACRCHTCGRIKMLSDISMALKTAALQAEEVTENLDIFVELSELIDAADKLVDFHVSSHLLTQFGLSIEEAKHVVEYKNSLRLESQDNDDEIPF